MAELDLDTVRHALSVAREYGFAEVELRLGGDAFSAQLSPEPRTKQAESSSNGPSELVHTEPDLAPIRATLVGYYQESPTPLRVGARVAKGDVVAVIAALGLANDVDATVSGEVVEVLVETDQPVEYGQPLAMVRTK